MDKVKGRRVENCSKIKDTEGQVKVNMCGFECVRNSNLLGGRVSKSSVKVETRVKKVKSGKAGEQRTVKSLIDWV